MHTTGVSGSRGRSRPRRVAVRKLPPRVKARDLGDGKLSGFSENARWRASQPQIHFDRRREPAQIETVGATLEERSVSTFTLARDAAASSSPPSCQAGCRPRRDCREAEQQRRPLKDRMAMISCVSAESHQ